MRRTLFNANSRYRVKRNFMSGTSTFIAGETLVFESDGYSWYDNSLVHQFRSERDGERKVWFLHEDKSAESWRESSGLSDQEGCAACRDADARPR